MTDVLVDNQAALRAKLQELRIALAWMGIIADNITDGVCVIDDGFKIVYANDYFSTIAGTSKIAVLGKQFQTVIDTSHAAQSVRTYFASPGATLKAIEQHQGEIEQTSSDGIRRQYHLSARYLTSTEQAVIMLHDITAKKELDAMRKNFNNLAAHQLRTPLTAIKLYAEMLEDGMGGDLTADQLKLLEPVIDSSKHMNRIINLLLDIARNDDNNFRPTYGPVSLDPLLSSLLKELGQDVSEKKLIVKVSLPTTVTTFSSDENMLREILSNLISNAVRYTPSGGSIDITAEHYGSSLIISVKDSGIGIKIKDQSEVFSQFYRAENAILTAEAGSGLGLYLVKKLVHALGGTISLTSRQHKGSTFSVAIPYTEPQ